MSTENISWFVARTRPIHRIEFEVRRAINQHECPALVPFEEKWIQKPNGKWDEKKFPLFPCYVFIGLVSKDEFQPLKDAVNDLAERMGQPSPILGLIGPGGGQPAKLTTAEVERFKQASMERPTEVNIHRALQVGSEVEIFRGAWAGRTSRVEQFTKHGIKARLEVFNAWHVVEIPMKNVRAA